MLGWKSKEPWRQGQGDGLKQFLWQLALTVVFVATVVWLLDHFAIEPSRTRYEAQCKALGGESAVYFARGGRLCVTHDGRILFPTGD